jgi:hypothetical protein
LPDPDLGVWIRILSGSANWTGKVYLAVEVLVKMAKKISEKVDI